MNSKDSKPYYLFILLLSVGWFFTWLNYQVKLSTMESMYLHAENNNATFLDKYERETFNTKLLEETNSSLKHLAMDYKQRYEIEKIKPGKVVRIGSNVIKTTDTLYLPIDSIKYITSKLPTYYLHDSTPWHTFNLVIGSDTGSINYTITNKFVTWDQKISSWYQADQYQVNVINLNPKTRSIEKIEYQVKAKRKYRGAIFVAGILSGYFLLK
jgi:hypothetical protein